MSVDAGLPAWLVELFDAGRGLATLIQQDVDACGNAPPHPDDCNDCRPHREAIHAWMRAVVAARKANATRQRCSTGGCGYVTASELDEHCGACGSYLVVKDERRCQTPPHRRGRT